MNSVSIIIPAYNAEKTIAECLASIQNLDWDGEREVILVNDGSTDRTAEIAATFSGVKVISVPNGGAPRATNIGIQAAHYDIVASVDADVVLERGWLKNIVYPFEDPNVAGVTGYVEGASSKLIGRITGYHTELRHLRRPQYVDAMGSANTAYRRQAIIEVGMFNEQTIDYDVDISYRLRSAGYQLIFNKEAKCKHYWREDLKGYLKQQYGYACGSLDMVQKFGKTHNQASTLGMTLQVPLTLIIILGAIVGSILASPLALIALILLPMVHLPDTIAIFNRKRDWGIVALPWLFTLRNFAWIYGAIVWGLRWAQSRLKT